MWSSQKKAILPLDKLFWPPPQPKRGPLTIFRPDPPLWRTFRRHCKHLAKTISRKIRGSCRNNCHPPLPPRRTVFMGLLFVFCKVSTVEIDWLFEILRLQTEDTEKVNFREVASTWRFRRFQVPFCSKIICPCSYLPIVEINMNDMVFRLTKTCGKRKGKRYWSGLKYFKKVSQEKHLYLQWIVVGGNGWISDFPRSKPSVAFLEYIRRQNWSPADV